MDLTRTPSAIASEAAEQIRQLNHRTLDPKAFTQPGDVSDVANALAVLVQRLPQAIQQLEAGLDALYERDAIRLDDMDPRAVSANELCSRVSGVLSAFRDSRDDLERVHADLSRATGPLSHMGGLWEDDEEDGTE